MARKTPLVILVSISTLFTLGIDILNTYAIIVIGLYNLSHGEKIMQNIKILVIAQTDIQASSAQRNLSKVYEVVTCVHPREPHELSMITLVSEVDVLVVFGNYAEKQFYVDLNHHQIPTVYINPMTAPHLFELDGLSCKHEVMKGWICDRIAINYCVNKLLE
jgi:hypothetical protein